MVPMKFILIASGLAGMGLSYWNHLHLPARVAVHFGSGGLPNGWMSSGGDFWMTVFLFLLTTLTFLFSSELMRITPVKFINLPNREYWLAEGRREPTIRYFSGWMTRFGLATNVFLLIATQMVYAANKSVPVRLPEGPFLTALGVYAVFAIFQITLIFRRFGKKDMK